MSNSLNIYSIGWLTFWTSVFFLLTVNSGLMWKRLCYALVRVLNGKPKIKWTPLHIRLVSVWFFMNLWHLNSTTEPWKSTFQFTGIKKSLTFWIILRTQTENFSLEKNMILEQRKFPRSLIKEIMSVIEKGQSRKYIWQLLPKKLHSIHSAIYFVFSFTREQQQIITNSVKKSRQKGRVCFSVII